MIGKIPGRWKAAPRLWTPRRNLIVPSHHLRWRRRPSLLNTAGKLQRDPATGKRKRNPTTGKLRKNTADITNCCCEGDHDCDTCVGTSCAHCNGCTPDCFTVTVEDVVVTDCLVCPELFTGTDEDGFDIEPQSVNVTGTWTGGTYEIPQTAACTWELTIDPFDLSLELYADDLCTGELFCTITRVTMRVQFLVGTPSKWAFFMGFQPNISDNCSLGQLGEIRSLFFGSKLEEDFVCEEGGVFTNENVIACPAGGDVWLSEEGTATVIPCCTD